MSNILLGVSAGIAAYKSADLASKLTQQGHAVRVVLTPHAQKFVTPLTFRAVTAQPVFTDTFEEEAPGRIEHISLAEWANLLVIAPATADVLGKLASGLGDNVLTTLCLAFDGPVVLAPAMNDRMWANRIVQANVKRLREVAGYEFIGPDAGHLACGTVGYGRMVEVDRIIQFVGDMLSRRTES